MAPSKHGSKQSKGKGLVVKLGEEEHLKVVSEPDEGGTFSSPKSDELLQIRMVQDRMLVTQDQMLVTQDQLLATVSKLSSNFELLLQSRTVGGENREIRSNREGIGTNSEAVPVVEEEQRQQFQRRSQDPGTSWPAGDRRQHDDPLHQDDLMTFGGRRCREEKGPGVHRQMQHKEPVMNWRDRPESSFRGRREAARRIAQDDDDPYEEQDQEFQHPIQQGDPSNRWRYQPENGLRARRNPNRQKFQEDDPYVAGNEGCLKGSKISFPTFDGRKDPISWFSRVEKFFKLHQIQDHLQVELASFHLEDDAQVWYDMMQDERGTPSWTDLKEAMNLQFGPSEYEDFYGDLTRLKQESSVQEFTAQFNRMITRADYMTEKQKAQAGKHEKPVEDEDDDGNDSDEDDSEEDASDEDMMDGGNESDSEEDEQFFEFKTDDEQVVNGQQQQHHFRQQQMGFLVVADEAIGRSIVFLNRVIEDFMNRCGASISAGDPHTLADDDEDGFDFDYVTLPSKKKGFKLDKLDFNFNGPGGFDLDRGFYREKVISENIGFFIWPRTDWRETSFSVVVSEIATSHNEGNHGLVEEETSRVDPRSQQQQQLQQQQQQQLTQFSQRRPFQSLKGLKSLAAKTSESKVGTDHRVLLTPDDDRVLASQVLVYARKFAEAGIAEDLVEALHEGITSPSAAPDWFSTLQSLTTLVMENAELTGTVPTSIFSFPPLQKVKLSNNRFSGALDIGQSINYQLQLVDLQFNNISQVTVGSGYTDALELFGNPVCSRVPNLLYCQLQQPREKIKVTENRQSQTEGFGSHLRSASLATDLRLGTNHPPLDKKVDVEYQSVKERLKDSSQCLSSVVDSESIAANTYLVGSCQKDKVSPASVKSFDACEIKSLLRELIEMVGRQEAAIHVISKTIAYCKSGNQRRCTTSLRGDIWFNFAVHDRVGKMKVAKALDVLMFGSSKNLICVLKASASPTNYSAQSEVQQAGDQILRSILHYPTHWQSGIQAGTAGGITNS